MEKEVGTVKTISNGRAMVVLKSKAGCSTCGARFACAAGEGPVRELRIANTLNARPGERVEIGFKPGSRVLASFIIFVLPILLVLAGYFAGASAGRTQNSGILGAGAGLLIGLLLLAVLNRLYASVEAFRPRMLRRLPALR